MSAKQFETGISKKKERIMLLYFIALFFRDKRDSRTTRRSAPPPLLPLRGIDVHFFSSLPDQSASMDRLSSDRETSGHSCALIPR
ncbi:hypothetical protein SJDPG12_00610 [Porphyromonas gingivalis SJD12]|nr:hypothetical protein SJDPG12_00610 [Porphyromonas gingivalis SJD12]